ncbi:hypothetical protein O9929_20615 [Vibrio lentus]|nr:hypothetical protein [Vibrio lentus]
MPVVTTSSALIYHVYAVDSDSDDSMMSPLSVTIGDDVQIMQDSALDIVEPNLRWYSDNRYCRCDAKPKCRWRNDHSIRRSGQLRTLDQNDNGEQQFSFTEGGLFITLEGEVRFEPNRDRTLR